MNLRQRTLFVLPVNFLLLVSLALVLGGESPGLTQQPDTRKRVGLLGGKDAPEEEPDPSK